MKEIYKYNGFFWMVDEGKKKKEKASLIVRETATK